MCSGQLKICMVALSEFDDDNIIDSKNTARVLNFKPIPSCFDYERIIEYCCIDC